MQAPLEITHKERKLVVNFDDVMKHSDKACLCCNNNEKNVQYKYPKTVRSLYA